MKMKTWILAGLLAGGLAAQTGSSEPTIAERLKAVEDIVSNQDIALQVLGKKILPDYAEGIEQAFAYIADQQATIEELKKRVDTLEKAQPRRAAGPEHNLDVYGREAN